MDQALPFHDSTRVAPPEGLADDPTALQLVASRHEMPSRPLDALPLGLGLGMMDQAFPSHDSIRVCVVVAFPEEPTVVQSVALTQEMPCRSLEVLPTGLGLGTPDQGDAAASAPPTCTTVPASVPATSAEHRRSGHLTGLLSRVFLIPIARLPAHANFR